ncbi:mechanosensitive ion channel domain-containing protein [Desulfonatronum parangueonense]
MRKSKLLITLVSFVLFGILNVVALSCLAMAEQNVPLVAGNLPAAIPSERVDAEVARLSDVQVREELLARLHHEAQARDETELIVPTFSERVREKVFLMGENLRTIAAAVPKTGGELFRALALPSDGRGFLGFLGLVGSLLLMIGAGLLAEWIFRRRVRPAISNVPDSESIGLLNKVALNILHAILRSLNVLAFAAGSILILVLLHETDSPPRLFLSLILEAIIAARIVFLVAIFFLAPHNQNLRLMRLGDATTSQVYNWIKATVIVGLITRILYEMVAKAHGDEGVILLLATIKESVLGILIIAAILYFKNTVALTIRENAPDPDNPSSLRLMFANLWHLAAILYFLLVSAYWVLRLWVTGQPSPGFTYVGSLIIIPLYFLLDELVQLLFRRISEEKKNDVQVPSDVTKADVQDDKTPSFQNGEQKGDDSIIPFAAIKQKLPVARRVVRLVIAFVLVTFLLNLRGISLPLGEAVTRAALEIFFTLLAVHLIWELIKSYIERRLQTVPEGKDSGGSLARTKTLLPLFKKTVGVFLFVVTFLIVLSSLGLNIGPMLAGASIFGLAIGLGSQSLVKDIVAGVFFLMDDTFRVGDYVRMDDREGYVEKMSLRTISLRHFLGSLNVVPYGNINSVINFTRGPMTVKYKIPLPLGTDPALVKKVVKEVNKTIMADPEMGPNMLQPLKSQGCKGIQDSVMQFGIKFTAKPGTQFKIKRESLELLRKALAEKGIDFACRSVKVDLSNFPGLGKTLAPEQVAQMLKPDMPSNTDVEGSADVHDGKEMIAEAKGEPKRLESPGAARSVSKTSDATVQPFSHEQLLLIEAAVAATVTLLDDDDHLRAGKKKKKVRK